LVVASAIAVVLAAGFLPGAGRGSLAAPVRGTHGIPAGLSAAIHARFGTRAGGASSAAAATARPYDLGEGVALSADGTTALVGAERAVYVFHVSNAGSWSSRETPTATLTNHAAGAISEGWAVALSADGTTAFVADYRVKGWKVDVFHTSAEDAWASSSTPTATLTVSSLKALGSLAASADGTTLVVGAPLAGGEKGKAYVFHASSEGAWASTSTPTATLSNEKQPAGDFLAEWHVAISGDGMTVLLSDDLNPYTRGGAYVFHVSAENAWASSSTPTAILTETTSDPDTALGVSLALSGDGTVAFLGDSYANGHKGKVDVYAVAGGDAWTTTATPTAKLSYSGSKGDDFFGQQMAPSADGKTVVVTALFYTTGRGRVYTFHVANEGDWVSSSAPAATLTNGGVHSGNSLGEGLAISADGGTALLGAPGVRFHTGAAYAFHVADAASWASSSTPTAALTVKTLNACVVPRLRALRVPVAKALLKTRSCRLGKVSRVHVTTGKKGRVQFQSRKPGSRLRIGTKVNVKVKK
jgi:hypothetical protein